jgi:hypothetical protein
MNKLTTMICLLLFMIAPLHAQEIKQIRITTIKANKELPKILYIVPWKDVETPKKPPRELVLHSLYGDLFDPVLPDRP